MHPRYLCTLLALVLSTLPAQVSAQSRIEIPVVACPLQTMTGPQHVSTPSFVAVTAPVPKQFQSQLVYYSIGTLGAFGPRGWHCHAHSGTSGSSIYVFPGTTDPFGTDLQGRIGLVMVLQLGYGGHYVEVLQTGAPLFADLRAIASKALKNPSEASMLKGVRLQAVSGEQVTHVAATVTTFCDPPRVRASGAGSGGAYKSCGVVTEDWSQVDKKAEVAAPDLRVTSMTFPASSESLAQQIIALTGSAH